MIKLIITDDHPVIRDGIKTILAGDKEIEVVGFAGDGPELMEILETTPADVILMDINMPGITGIEATKLVKKKYPDIKVISFSQYDEKRFIKQSLKNGANGYLLKNSPASELIQAIKMVHEGGMYLDPDLPNIFGDTARPKSNYLFPDLSKREMEVLKEICKEKNTNEIAETLFISPNTVETHRSNLLLKVGVKNTACLVKWAIENDIV